MRRVNPPTRDDDAAVAIEPIDRNTDREADASRVRDIRVGSLRIPEPFKYLVTKVFPIF
jgi:hypothetical protein